MIKLEKMYEFETRKDLVVEFESKNFGLKIIGWEKETSEFFIKLDFEKIDDKEIKIEDIVDAKYNKKKNTLNIKLNEPENVGHMNSQLELRVPHVTEIIGKTENGGISIENLHGIQTVTTENGGINIDHVNGNLICKTENGSINLMDCNSNANLETENGLIKMKKCDGNLKLISENGAIKMTDCKGSLELKHENGTIRILDAKLNKATITNQNGTIYYEFTPIDKGQFKFENQNGKIHLVIPDEIPYKIEAKNQMGRFNVGLEGNYDRRKEGNEQIIEMTKGSGKVEISAKNRMGSISLMSHPMKESKFKFNMSFVSDAMDKAMENIPEEYFNKEKIIKKMEKAKKKLKNIKIPDMEDINRHVSEAMDNVNKELKNLKFNVSADDFTEMADEKISSVVNTIHEKFAGEDLTEKQKNTIDERSRLKILQMLQEGKITAEEAEKLISTMEERDGR